MSSHFTPVPPLRSEHRLYMMSKARTSSYRSRDLSDEQLDFDSCRGNMKWSYALRTAAEMAMHNSASDRVPLNRHTVPAIIGSTLTTAESTPQAHGAVRMVACGDALPRTCATCNLTF